MPIACGSVGIDRVTFQRWLDKYPEFAQQLAAEKRRVILEELAAIRGRSMNWQGNAWFLERVYRDYFAAPAPGIAFGVQQNHFVITYEKAKEIEAMRSELLPEVNTRLGLTNGEEVPTDGKG